MKDLFSGALKQIEQFVSGDGGSLSGGVFGCGESALFCLFESLSAAVDAASGVLGLSVHGLPVLEAPV